MIMKPLNAINDMFKENMHACVGYKSYRIGTTCFIRTHLITEGI